MGLASRMVCVVALCAVAACVQQPLYMPPYTSAPPAMLDPPLPVVLVVTYSRDGKRDTKREQDLGAQLHDLLAAGRSFRPAASADAVGTLTVAVADNATTQHRSLLAGFSAMLGHLFIGQPDFTPTGRRTARALDVDISYTPSGGAAQSQVYTSALVTVTNNTQEPTDLVPVPDRKQAELTLIGNDLNLFAADLEKSQGAPKP